MKGLRIYILLMIFALSTMVYGQRITVTRPNGGESWVIGDSEPINWTATGITEGTFKITIWRNSGATLVGTIAQGITIGTRSISWDVGRLLSGRVIDPRTDYRIKVRHTGFTSNDFSDGNFTLSTASDPPPPPERTITVSAPNGGEPWPRGGNRSITWTSSGITTGRYKLTLYRGTALQGPIAENIPHPTTNYAWTSVGTLADGTVVPYAINYKVKVELMGGGVEDLSDGFFRIVRAISLPGEMRVDAQPVVPEGSTPVIRVVSPNGGERIRKVEHQEIRWTAVDAFGTPRIKLMNGSRTVKNYPPDRISYLRTSSGYRWTWILTDDIPPGSNYKIRIEKSDFSRSRDESDGTFTILGGADLVVTDPNGGSWTTSNNKSIHWRASGIRGNLNIKLRHATAGSEYTIATNVPPTPSRYFWTVGLIEGARNSTIIHGHRYKVVICKADGSLCAESAVFPIAKPTISVSSPNSSTRHRGDRININWNATRGFHGNVDIIIQYQSGSSAHDYETLLSNTRSRSWSWRIWPHPPRGTGELDPPVVDRRYRIKVVSTRVPLEIKGESEWFMLRD